MKSFSDEALKKLEERGYLKGDRILRKPWSHDLVTLLEKDHVVSNEAEVDQKSATIDELLMITVGIVEPDLRQAISEMTSRYGRLQRDLNGDGYVLCNAKVERPITSPDGSTNTVGKFSAKFVSNDADIVRHHLIDQMSKDNENRLARQRDVLDLIVTRIPALEGIHTEFAGQLGQQVQLALG